MLLQKKLCGACNLYIDLSMNRDVTGRMIVMMDQMNQVVNLMIVLLWTTVIPREDVTALA